ncbi:diguanylate cyclase domain-containing protein [Vibrio furnissii]|uniref:diguanylate cyclase domain-containing protein n=1 Tax=Vibrio furnissii TaxID=29494 RepID=UPI001EECA703|nr:diguanylate cyclase [Vibrio furnissii]MCG6233807.1 diguanylate cyclase [Vibrio furnissii]MCG6259899.1 diguanylate cyclase [Vibrio furnissii]
MIHSVSRKLTLLFVATSMLAILIAYSLWDLSQEQKRTQSELTQIMQIQRSVDMLRSQLWIFLQYDDANSLDQVYIAQQNLSAKLSKNPEFENNIQNLARMNGSLAALLRQERELDYDRRASSSDFVGASELLHSRYNMLVQNMTEELLYLQKVVLEKSAESQRSALMTSALHLLVFSVIVSVIAFMILKRVRHGFATLKQGIAELAQGDLSSRLSIHQQDSEFVTLAQFFNRMKESLQSSIVTREELQHEVARQTAKLEQQKEQLRFLSEKDPLTGMLNRRAFKEHLHDAIVHANRTGVKLALLFIDLDKFKAINDSKGHDVGDEVLMQIGARLEQNIRESDFCGRFGGDEFVVCLNLIKDFEGITAKTERLIEQLSQPMAVCGEPVSVGVSIGISLYPDQSQDMVALLRLADEAMYKAKSAEGNRFFCPLLHQGCDEDSSKLG